MSRHLISTEGTLPEVWVGWDPPLGTYFADVIDTDPDGEDALVASTGNLPGEVTSVTAIVLFVVGYADLDGQTIRQLVADRIADR